MCLIEKNLKNIVEFSLCLLSTTKHFFPTYNIPHLTLMYCIPINTPLNDISTVGMPLVMKVHLLFVLQHSKLQLRSTERPTQTYKQIQPDVKISVRR